MRAWQLTGPGNILQTLQLAQDVPRPRADELQQGQILVKVVSTGINPADYKVPELGVVARAVYRFPMTPGMDLAGLVEATGPGVEGVGKNDKIMARMDPRSNWGPLAEYVVLEAGTWVPCAGVDMDEAAGTLTTALTAYQCFKPYVKEGDKVFINGGGGGLGTAGIQIAKLMGCHVTVSCSTGKIDFCKGLGADEVIDYKKEDVTAELVRRGADKVVIMDNVGNSPTDLYRRCDKILTEAGAYVFIGGRISPGSVVNMASSLLRPGWLGGQRRKFVAAVTRTVEEDARQIAEWMSEGKYKTLVDSTFAFEEAKEAFERLKTDQCRGKVIVRVASQ